MKQIEVGYALTTSKGFIENIALQLSEAYDETVYVEGNSLILPPSLGQGRFDFFCIEPGLSVCLMDCVFFKTIRFKRQPLLINDFHIIHLNLSIVPVMVKKDNQETIDIGTDWQNAIFYSTSAKGAEMLAIAGNNVRSVLVIYTRAWLLSNYQMENIPTHAMYVNEFKKDQPMQFSMDLDIRLLLLAHDMLTLQAPGFMFNVYFEGYARRVIALVANTLASLPQDEVKPDFEKIMKILAIKKQISESLDQPLPLLEELAEGCKMSKSNFIRLFRILFRKNYSDYFGELRMQKASDLLLEGMVVSEAGHAVGYKNLGHFAKAFKEYFHISPKHYKKNITLPRTF